MYFAFFELWNQTDDPLLKWPFLIFRSPPFNLTQNSTMAAFAVCLLVGNCFVVESKKKPCFSSAWTQSAFHYQKNKYTKLMIYCNISMDTVLN